MVHNRSARGRPTMLTRMTERNGAVVLEVFRGCLSRRGDKGRDDRMFLEAMHCFAVRNITWRALPPEYGNWNSISRLSRSGVFVAFFQAPADLEPDSPPGADVRQHRGADPRLRGRGKRGRTARRSAARAAASRPGSTSRATSTASRSRPISLAARRATAASSRPCSTSGRTSRRAPS